MDFNNKIQNFESLQCVWMTSEVVRYKLCDNDFDCDHCLLNKALQNSADDNKAINGKSKNIFYTDIIDDKIVKIDSLSSDDNVIYLKNNLVLKNLFGNAYYIGISTLGYFMLDNAVGFNYCRDGSSIKEDDLIAQFIGDWGSVKIHSPFNFYSSGRLKNEIGHSGRNEWLSIIEAEPAQIKEAEIDKNEYEDSLISVKKLLSQSKQYYPSVGVTLNDGGQKVKYLYEIIGKQNYYEILSRLFSQNK